MEMFELCYPIFHHMLYELVIEYQSMDAIKISNELA